MQPNLPLQWNHLTSWSNGPIFHSRYQLLASNDVHICERYGTSPGSQDTLRAKPPREIPQRVSPCALFEPPPKTSIWGDCQIPIKNEICFFFFFWFTNNILLCSMTEKYRSCFQSLLWVRERESLQPRQPYAPLRDPDFKSPLTRASVCFCVCVCLHPYTHLSSFCVPDTYCFQHLMGSLSLRN